MTEIRRRPQVWGRIPPRNKDFTGREDLLERLRQGVSGSVTAVLPTALHGLGGVGKTQIAAEYAHRYKSDYDLVWWVPSDQPMLIASSIARLAPHLDLPKANEIGVAESAEAVVEALRRGEPYDRWLLIFDNAHAPESIMQYVPDGPGGILITSRNFAWDGVVSTLTVDVFSREESRRFLDRRVPGIGGTEADALAEALGDLPLALDQAGAMQSETGMPVREYLTLLRDQTGKLLAEGRPMEYDVPLTATWALSVTTLREEQPDAVELLHLLAFFGSDPIPRDVFSTSRGTVEPPLSGILDDPLRFSRGVGALGRYALVQIDRENQTLLVHRLVQALLREDVSESERDRFRLNVQRLLAAAVPGPPDDTATWPTFARLMPHLEPSEIARSADPAVRRPMHDMVRYLYQSGNAPGALSLAKACLEAWEADPSSDARDLCTMKRHLSVSLRFVGEYEEAFRVGSQALQDAETALGADDEETLRLTNNHCTDLRAMGRFSESFALATSAAQRHRDVFGDDNERTLRMHTSLALDLTLTSQYEEAERLLKHVYGALRDLYGTPNHPTAQIVMNNLVRVIRLRGDYAEARELGEDVYAVGVSTLGADHPTTLRAASDLAVAMRKAESGSPEVLHYAEDLVHRYRRLMGDRHPDKLAAEMALVNAYREARRIDEAMPIAELTTLAYAHVYGTDHPYAHGCRGNLALLMRLAGEHAKAHDLHEFIVTRLSELLGPTHHYTLTAVLGLAGDRAALGKLDRAVDTGERALDELRRLLGPDHPMTLGCMANLALDLSELGRADDARAMRAEALEGIRRRLGDGHPAHQAVVNGGRLDFDFDPPPI
ncbi:FxSxx-COOH system tetratricopeptide repeat protein [Nonomuraea harbinensis]|uniref:FxSxx-COOH system tetratricopeptide repeat protein n=1 Tax=Nonomuraea harbinensis TaxID=1286938 RepID=A0ABW1C1N0_9ACTN|nr:FxSxx-COOH system tetratricopeptide repeat protein [Nonomuraea harbinensis]